MLASICASSSEAEPGTIVEAPRHVVRQNSFTASFRSHIPRQLRRRCHWQRFWSRALDCPALLCAVLIRVSRSTCAHANAHALALLLALKSVPIATGNGARQFVCFSDTQILMVCVGCGCGVWGGGLCVCLYSYVSQRVLEAAASSPSVPSSSPPPTNPQDPSVTPVPAKTCKLRGDFSVTSQPHVVV